jgi:hypothetical protein
MPACPNNGGNEVSSISRRIVHHPQFSHHRM